MPEVAPRATKVTLSRVRAEKGQYKTGRKARKKDERKNHLAEDDNVEEQKAGHGQLQVDGWNEGVHVTVLATASALRPLFPATKWKENAPARLLLRRTPIDKLVKRRRVRQAKEYRKSVGPAELEAESEEREEDEVEGFIKGSEGLWTTNRVSRGLREEGTEEEVRTIQKAQLSTIPTARM